MKRSDIKRRPLFKYHTKSIWLLKLPGDHLGDFGSSPAPTPLMLELWCS